MHVTCLCPICIYLDACYMAKYFTHFLSSVKGHHHCKVSPVLC